MDADFHFHLDVLIWVALLQGSYLLAVGPLRRRFGWADTVSRTKVFLFSLGALVIYISEGTIIHELSEQYLFSVHMAQHMLLILVVPPLLLAGTPGWLARAIIRPGLVLTVMRFLTKPVTALLLFNATLVFWHIPEFYGLTLSIHEVHIVEHFTFLASAIIMWWPVMSPHPDLPRLPYYAQMMYLFVQSFVPVVIGGIITFADRMVYQGYVDAPRIWNISPALDQQMGGLIMKIVGSLVLWAVITVIFFTWFNKEEAESPSSPPTWEEVEGELTEMGLTKK